MQDNPKDFRVGIEVYDYLIEECGVLIAQQVAAQYGGMRKKIPANLTATTKMKKEIGELAAKALIKWRGGEVYDFPLWGVARYAKVRQIALRSDISDNEKAKVAGVNRRTIVYHKTKERRKKQLNFLDQLDE